MAAQRPLRASSRRGISPEQTQADSASLKALESLLPDLSDYVRGYLARNATADLSAALGDAPALARLVGELARSSGRPADPHVLERDVRARLARGTIDPSPRVEAEAALAKEQLVRHWVNLVLYGWGLLQKPPSGIVLKEHSLLPETDGWSPDNKERFDEYFDLSKASVYDAIALDGEGGRYATENFSKNVRKRLLAGPIALPRGMQLVRPARQIVARPVVTGTPG